MGFNHGLFPASAQSEAAQAFQGTKLQNEGKHWTEEDDLKLLDLAEQYDVTFGDPWIYISWEMQRCEDDVRDRFVQLEAIPRERMEKVELAITKSSRPLLLNRKVRMIPPDLYIVPSKENFTL